MLMIIAVLFLCVIGFGIYVFNVLVRGSFLVREAWSDIDVQLKRRADLVPALMEAVKGYAAHEKQVFRDVTEARTSALNSATVEERARGENTLSREVRAVMAIAESYPDLKASPLFINFQEKLVEVEDQIQYARRYYNGTVRDYNLAVHSFPSNLIASLFRFRPGVFFELELATERRAPEVNF